MENPCKLKIFGCSRLPRSHALFPLSIGLLLLLLAAAAAGFVLFGAHKTASAAHITLPAGISARLQAGDLIFRVGDGWQSETVRGITGVWRQEKRGDPYSHVGMLVGAPAHWQVVHAVPAEIAGRANAVVRDDLDFFLAPERAHGVAVYHVSASAQAHALAVQYALQRLGTPFQITGNDRAGQYCTTLVWAAWQHAGIDLGAPFEHLDVPFFTGDYLLPHSLRTAPRLHLVFERDPNTNTAIYGERVPSSCDSTFSQCS